MRYLAILLILVSFPVFAANGNGNPGGIGVSTLTNSDGTLTFSPSLGNVIGSINLSHANTWLSTQTFPSPAFTGTVTGNGTIPNAVLVNSSITVNGTACTLGSSCTPSAGTVNLGTSTAAANPQISGDATSGLYTAGAALVDVVISGTKRAEWSSTGEAITGVQTITSSSATAQTIGANGATNPVWAVDASTASVVTGLILKGGATGGFSTITATDSGSNTNIGVRPKGTGSVVVTDSGTTPTQVAPDFGTPMLQVEGTGAGTGFGVFRFATSTLSPAKTGIGHSCNATVGSFSSCAAGAQLGQFWFEGVGTAGSFVESSLIEGDVDPSGTPGSSISPGALIFKTANNSGTITEGLRVNYLQNIGIGSTTPRAKVDVSQSTDSIILPIGTTGTRPATGVNGMIRYNSTNTAMEIYANNTWQNEIQTTSQSPITTTLTTAVTQGAAGYYLTFSDTSSLSTGEIVQGTNIPAQTVIDYIGNGSSVKSTTASGGGSGYNVTVASATGIVVGMLITDTTSGARIGNNCVVNFISGTTITSNCSLASVVNADGLNFYPTIKLSQTTSGTVGASASISFTTNATNLTLTGLTVNGDTDIGGDIKMRGVRTIRMTNSTINGDPSIPVASISSVALGVGALNSAIAEGGNTAIGAYALNAMAGQQGFYEESSFSLLGNGGFNTAIGLGAMLNATPTGATASSGAGSFNTAVGAFSALSITTGNRNTILGEAAAQNLTTGSFNVFVGSENSNIGAFGSGAQNVIVGADVAQYLTSASSNVIIGYLALDSSSVTPTSDNVAIGHSAMNGMIGNSTTDYNVALGSFAMGGSGTAANNTGAQNTALGTASLLGLSSGGNNVSVGFQAGKVLTTGGNNTIVGFQVASTTLVSGADNILIGVSSAIDTAAAGTSNTINIGGTGGSWFNVTGTNTNSTEAATMRGSLTLTDLATDATHTDRTVCQDTTSKTLFFGSGASGICLGTSSARYKHDIHDDVDGLAEITSLKPVNFYYKKGYGDDGAKEQYGFIAEDVVKILPKVVGLDKEGKPNSVDMMAMIPVMVKAIQQQQDEIKHLKAVNYNPCNAFNKFGQFIMGCR